MSIDLNRRNFLGAGAAGLGYFFTAPAYSASRLGRKPNDYSPSAFQGVHAPYVLVIIDEANGVRGRLHDALDSLIANNASKLLMIGNPDEPAGEFYEATKSGSGFHVVSISAFDSPNFTGEELPSRMEYRRRCLIGGRSRMLSWTRHIAPSVEKWRRQAPQRYAAFPIPAVTNLLAIAQYASA